MFYYTLAETKKNVEKYYNYANIIILNNQDESYKQKNDPSTKNIVCIDCEGASNRNIAVMLQDWGTKMRHFQERETANKTILVIDDDESILDTYSVIIKKMAQGRFSAIKTNTYSNRNIPINFKSNLVISLCGAYPLDS